MRPQPLSFACVMSKPAAAGNSVSSGPIGDPHVKPYGNGALLWFELDDFHAAIARVEELRAEVIKPRHRNPSDGDGGPNYWEIWLRDPDSYTVVCPPKMADEEASTLVSPMGQ